MTPSVLPQPSAPDLTGLVSRARAVDGQPPFSDQSLVDLRMGSRRLLLMDSAAAILGDGEAEFVVDPDARGRGNGTAILERIITDTVGDLLFWAHGDHPAARALAASHRLEPVRTLLQLENERIEPGPPPSSPDDSPESAGGSAGIEIRSRSTRFTSFRTGEDEDAWVALNARIFSFHPDQGSVTRADLEQLETEDWFNPGDFLLAWDGDELLGYCWLKIDGPKGEIYVIGVAPEKQGSGLGRALMAAGYQRLAARGIHQVRLYVEGDNEKALALYRSLGFADHSVDVQYRLTR